MARNKEAFHWKRFFKKKTERMAKTMNYMQSMFRMPKTQAELAKETERQKKGLMEHGIYTQQFRDHPDMVNRQYQIFLNFMQGRYGNDFDIINVAQNEFPRGICMTVTYRV